MPAGACDVSSVDFAKVYLSHYRLILHQVARKTHVVLSVDCFSWFISLLFVFINVDTIVYTLKRVQPLRCSSSSSSSSSGRVQGALFVMTGADDNEATTTPSGESNLAVPRLLGTVVRNVCIKKESSPLQRTFWAWKVASEIRLLLKKCKRVLIWTTTVLWKS